MTSKLTGEAPHPMGSFEDTTHAYEVGYAAGLATGQQAYKKIQAERDIIAAATAETLALACLQEAQRRRKMATDLKARAPVNEDNNLQYNRWIAGAISLEVMASKAHEITPTDALAALARTKGEAAGLQLRAEKAEAALAAGTFDLPTTAQKIKRAELLARSKCTIKQFDNWAFRDQLPFKKSGGGYTARDAEALADMTALVAAGMTVNTAREIAMLGHDLARTAIINLPQAPPAPLIQS